MVMSRTKPKDLTQLEWIRKQAVEFRKKAEETTLKGILSKHFEVSPDKPFTLDTAQARAFGFDIPDAWNIKALREGTDITFRQITQEGWEILGEDVFISPTGEQFTLGDIEALEDSGKLATGLFKSVETEAAAAPTIVGIEDPRLVLLEPFLVEDVTGEGRRQYDVRAAIIAGVDEQLLIDAFTKEIVDAARIEPAGFMWDYTQGKFIPADKEMLASRQLGYSGVALKACKGQSEALLMGAAAQKYGMFLCVQDLTCPGASFLHSASLAARISTVAAIEGNARQYCPAGSRGWDDRYPTMFHVTDGTLDTSVLTGPGLGY